jgi:hypothetical protein
MARLMLIAAHARRARPAALSLSALPSLAPPMVGVGGPCQGADDEDHAGAVNYQADDIRSVGNRL